MILRQLLFRTETRILPVIAGYWIHLPARTNYEEIIRLLCDKMLDPGALRKQLSGPYGRDISAGLLRLAENKGIEIAESFEEEFGTLRIAGPDKVLREKYWEHPVSVTEILYYRGLIYRHNQFIEDTVKDCYIIPDDLLRVLQPLLQSEKTFPDLYSGSLIVRPAIPSETFSVFPLHEHLPEMISLAAALKRSGHPFIIPDADIPDDYSHFVDMLLAETGMFSASGDPDTEKIRKFLISNKTAARLQLIKIWRNSSEYNELSENRNKLNIIEPPVFNKQKPRNAIINFLSQLEPETWWSLNGFISAIKNSAPSFLRDSFSGERWIIYDENGNDLNGRGSWFQLEGAYIEFLLFGPLQWLGIVQVSFSDNEKTSPSAFRISREGLFYIRESNYSEIPDEISKKQNLEISAPNISADGSIICSPGTSRYFLYMAARFCDIEKFRDSGYSFRLSPGSLAEAEKNGLSRDALLSLLRRFSKNALPPSLEKMLSNPRGYNLPATIYNATILTIPDPEILGDLIYNSRLSRWIIQQMNQTTLVIDPKGIAEIRRFLMENELFVDIKK